MRKFLINIKNGFQKNTKKKIDTIIIILLILIIIAVVGGDIAYNILNYRVEFYTMSSSKISEKMRIVFLSDLHLREYGKENERLLNDVKNLSPDLIILGGDFVIDRQDSYDNMLELCKKLKEISPVYGVLGNHEDVKVYIQGDKRLTEKFTAAGVNLLINDIKTVNIRGNEISIAGVDGNPSDFEKYGADEIMEKFDKDFSGFKICVAHVPTYFTETLEEYEFELGLAGHNHGGIINIPKLGPLYSREEGFFPKYAKGEHLLKNGAELIVSRGLGHSSAVPRINNIPEITVIDVC